MDGCAENSKKKGASSLLHSWRPFLLHCAAARDEWRSSHSALLDFGDFLAGDVAEDQKVGQGVAAEAIAAVDAARVSHAA